MSEPDDDDDKPLQEAIRRGPPATLVEAGELLKECMQDLEAIEEAHADDLLFALQEATRATMRLFAGQSPAGSPGPAKLFAPVMELVLALQMGASLDSTALFRSAGRRRAGRPPTPPSQVAGHAWAAAVMTRLMEGGQSKNEAARRVAGRLQRAGVRFAKTNPASTVSHWRDEAMGHGQTRLNTAYREVLAVLREQKLTEAELLDALDKAVAEGWFE